MPADTLQTLASWLAGAFDEALNPGEDPTTTVLAALGWESPPGGGDLGLGGIDVGRVVSKLAALDLSVGTSGTDSPVSLQLNVELLTEVLGLFDRIRTLAGGLAGRLAGAGSYLAQTQIDRLFLPRLMDYLVIRSVETRLPTVHAALQLLGIFRMEFLAADPAIRQVDHIRYAIDFHRLGQALTDPGGMMRETLGWGTPTFRPLPLIGLVGHFLQAVGLPAILEKMPRRVEERLLGRAVPEADFKPLPRVRVSLRKGLAGDPLDVGVALYGVRPAAPGGNNGGFGVSPYVFGTTEVSFPLADGLRLEVEGKPLIEKGVGLLVRPNGSIDVQTDILSGGAVGRPPGARLSFALARTKPADQPGRLVVLPGGSRIEYQGLAIRSGVRPGGPSGTQFFTEIELRAGRFVLDLGGAGELLKAVLPTGTLEAQFDGAIGWASGTSAYLRGSTALSVRFPINLSLGPVELESLAIGITPGAGGGLPVETIADVKAGLGPLGLRVDGIGVSLRFDIPDGRGGNLGPLDVVLRFRPPGGIGLTLDAGPVQGGGYLAIDPVVERYAGVLQVKLSFLEIVAFGIIEKIPGGPISFVAVLGIRFRPGIQLGFGFALSGVGGLVGLSRRADADLLLQRLATGAAGNVLFCEDPLHNAPALLGDLNAFFPQARGTFVVGPTLQINWLEFLRLDVGIIIELPGPSKLVILGSVRAIIGVSEDLALLSIRMDFMGLLDFEQELIAFDAHLVNSRVLGILRLTGGTALRLHYSSNAYLILSIGGFHPQFDPGPLHLPALARVGASLDIQVVAHIWVRCELYLAVTPNTVQTGANVEAGMELGPLSAHGYFRFDALIQFRPFAFDADFAAGFDIEVFDISFASVDLQGSISGPGPVVIHASASVRRLFLKVSASVTFTLGDDNADRPVPVPSLVKALEPELGRAANVRTDGVETSVRLLPPPDGLAWIRVVPRGSLVWEQKRVPLATLVDRFEGVSLGGPHQLALEVPPGWQTSQETDWFSPGTFTGLDLKSSQTLNNSTFVELPSGVRIGPKGDVQAPTVRPVTASLDLVKRPQKTRFSNLVAGDYLSLSQGLHGSLRDRDVTPAVSPGATIVTVSPEKFTVQDARGQTVATAQSSFQAFQLTREADGRIAVPETDPIVAI